jgi:hypothetical protein
LARRDATIRTHVLPEWDEVALSGVVNADVRAWAARLHAEGLSASSVRKAVFALRRILSAAVADRRLSHNPADDVPLPPGEAGEQRYLTAEEVATLADVIAPRRRALVLVAAYGSCCSASSPRCAESESTGSAVAWPWSRPHPWSDTRQGTAQGASVSPLLGNVYLHYVFDLWAQWWRRGNANGDMVIVRFADDVVLGFEHEGDAQRFLADLRGRFATFSMELAEDNKTCLIEFGRFAAERRARRGLGKPETFQFLGFTHICAKTRSGRFQLKRITDAKRMRAKLRAVKAELRRRMHLPIPEQGRWLESVVRGHCAYYAVPGNIAAVAAFRDQVTWLWYRSLRRRSQRTSLKLGAHAPPRCSMAPTGPHPASLASRAVRRSHLRQEPSALAAHAGIRAGAARQGGPYRDRVRALPGDLVLRGEHPVRAGKVRRPGRVS